MAAHKYELKYPDGRTRHVSREIRDSLLASLLIREVGFQKYRYVAAPVVLHSLAELSKISIATDPARRFIAGGFIVEYKGHRQYETALETPEGMTIRLAKDGVIA